MLEYVISKAREISLDHGRERVYSCIVTKRGKIVGESANLYDRSHPLQKKYSVKAGLGEERICLHSEVASIIKAAKKNPKDCKIYVARVGKGGRVLNAWPCPSCRLAISLSGFITSVEATVEIK